MKTEHDAYEDYLAEFNDYIMYDIYEYEEDCDEDSDNDEPGICNSCFGSGEGQSEDLTCLFCKGKGEV